MNFFERAYPTIQKGVPVIRLRPKTKIAFDTNWPLLATTDLVIIQKWNQETPDANCAAVAKADIGGVWFLEIDAPEVLARIEKETGQKMPKTYRVRSRPGRGHYYFRQTPESISLGNVAQGFVKGTDFSVRIHDQYVVAANSLHPLSGQPYEIISTADIIEAPQWLISWLQSQKVDAKSITYSLDSIDKIPHGAHDTALTSIAGRLRQAGLEHDVILAGIIEICEKRCVGYGIDYKQMCAKIAASICRYPPGKDNTVLVGGVPAGTSASTPALILSEELEEVPTFVVPPYPKFPAWVMEGTSIYKGLVKPYCDINSRYEEFMFMPAVALMLNYLGTKVRIEYKDVVPSLYMVLIGRKGRVIKSSSVKDAMKYFQYAGLLDQGGSSVRNAEGKTLVFTAGSPEGLGIEAQRTNCKNFVLFYDELSTLTSKAGIESSTLISNLLTMYESDKFSNLIKSKKETYSLDPGAYCTSLIACCTDKNFKTLWGKMSGVTSGLNDRFFFLYQPETFKEVTPPLSVNTQDGALETRKLIDKAIAKGVYSITNSSPLAARMTGEDKIENRQEIRAEKFGLFFAVDLGFDEITEDCIERGLALVEYERAVKRRLRPSESITKEASIQNEIVDFLLGCKGGVATQREIARNLHPERYGTSLWGQAFIGLVKAGQIQVQGNGTKADPRMVILLRAPEEQED
jgi:hypothetical protein